MAAFNPLIIRSFGSTRCQRAPRGRLLEWTTRPVCFKRVLVSLLGMTIALSSGCIPFPHVAGGRKIGAEKTRHLAVDLTNRSQVLDLLGPPDLRWSGQEQWVNFNSLQEARFFLYAWESVEGYLLSLHPGSGRAVGQKGHRFIVEFGEDDTVRDWGELGRWAVRYFGRQVSERERDDLVYPVRIPLGGDSTPDSLVIGKEGYSLERFVFREIRELEILSKKPSPEPLAIVFNFKFGSPDPKTVALMPAQRKLFEETGIELSLSVIWLPTLLEYLSKASPDASVSVEGGKWFQY